MKIFRWQIIIVLLAILVIGLLLLSEQTGFRLVSPMPTRGGVYTEALVGSLQRLNPVLDYYNQVDRDVDRLIFSSLIKYDSRGLPIPDLAESWGISFDGLIYNFSLRENAFWHDGIPVTAEDVVFTIDLMRDPDSVLPEDLKEFWSGLDVKALDEKALQIRLEEPFAPFMDYMNFRIVPKHILGGMTYNQIINSEFNINPIGSGPYQFESLIVEEGEIKGGILSTNPNFYGSSPFIQEFVFRYFPDHISAMQAYQDGSVQGLGDVSNTILDEALADPELSVYTMIKPEISMILLNLNNDSVEFFQDSNVRRALFKALDRRTTVNEVLNGQGILANVPVLPTSWAFFPGSQNMDQDNQEAAALLDEAGFTFTQDNTSGVLTRDGTPLSFSLHYPDDQVHAGIAEAIKSDWQKIGVDVKLISVPYDTLILDYLQPLTYEAALVDINYSRSPDPDPYPFWDQAQQTNGQNYSQWENRVASQYLEEARVTNDIDERAKLYRNFQAIFSEELPALPLYYPTYNFAVDQSIMGIRIGPMFDPSDRFWNVAEWYLIVQAGNGSS